MPLQCTLKLCFQTDDKGVFSTSLNEEFCIAASTFQLSSDQLWDLSYNSIECIFEDEAIKDILRAKWKVVQASCFSEQNGH